MTSRNRIGMKNNKTGLPVPSSKQNQLASRQIKRPLDSQPEEPAVKKKRTAFGDLTNTVLQSNNGGKKSTMTKKTQRCNDVLAVPRPSTTSTEANDVSWDIIEVSQGSNSSQGSTLSSILSSQNSTRNSQIFSQSQQSKSSQQFVISQNELNSQPGSHNAEKPRHDELRASPVGNIRIIDADISTADQSWTDIDAENMNDPCQVGLYASHIFEYYKEREAKSPVLDYLTWQKDLTPHMRAILVDWLVEVQENFELNHETLYLGVKMVDHYLCKNKVPREKLQLLGASALFMACKYDERCPPVLDDFLYICDDAYKREEIILMEMAIFRSIGFDMGFPLSYRFLRRYAKCAHASMELLTLARYVLEMSLMYYKFTQMRDSKVAAAALLLAQRMKDSRLWTSTMVHYTGYTEDDLLPVVQQLNTMISAPPNKQLATVRTKYSHIVFQRVALTTPLDKSDLAVEIAELNLQSTAPTQCALSPTLLKQTEDLVIMQLS